MTIYQVKWDEVIQYALVIVEGTLLSFGSRIGKYKIPSPDS